jgi:hypothetical protein
MNITRQEVSDLLLKGLQEYMDLPNDYRQMGFVDYALYLTYDQYAYLWEWYRIPVSQQDIVAEVVERYKVTMVDPCPPAPMTANAGDEANYYDYSDYCEEAEERREA